MKIPIFLLLQFCFSLSYVSDQYNKSLHSILQNISPPGTTKGTLVASPSKSKPDYFYMWIRDAALVMRSLVDEEVDIEGLFSDYAKISISQQQKDLPAGFGEPKFYVNGSVFKGPWGRPQNDGPALRILAFYVFCDSFGYKPEWYKPELPAKSLLKADLEYVAKNWRNQNFDLWEEVNGDHFYTRMVQYSALAAGQIIATTFKDPGAAEFYESQMKLLEESLENFWDEDRHYVKSALNFQDDHGKTSNLDISIILACLHSSPFTLQSFRCSNDKVMMTAARLVVSFQLEYSINWGREYPLLGRYPEDIYDGVGMSRGNPWILTTHAFAEFLYNIALEFAREKALVISKNSMMFFTTVVPHAKINPGILSSSEKYALVSNLTAVADGFMDSVREFTRNGQYTEQIHRDSGELRGAMDLTWSYTSFIQAIKARNNLQEFIKHHNYMFFSL